MIQAASLVFSAQLLSSRRSTRYDLPLNDHGAWGPTNSDVYTPYGVHLGVKRTRTTHVRSIRATIVGTELFPALFSALPSAHFLCYIPPLRNKGHIQLTAGSIPCTNRATTAAIARRDA